MKRFIVIVAALLVIYSYTPQIFAMVVAAHSEATQWGSNTNPIMIIVNKQNSLSHDYVPNDLVKIGVPFTLEGESEQMYMQKEAAYHLEQMFKEAKSQQIFLYGNSGYRSYKTQEKIYKRAVDEWGSETEANKWVARPGQSEHQTGLAIDVHTTDRIWVEDNAHKFGFIVRYPKGKEEITGYEYEPWHLRYVSIEHASKIYKQNLTLEEYLKK